MRLLVSVTGPEEVAAAIAGGAAIVDLKDPRAGALGAPSTPAVLAVGRAVRGRRPFSVALGEGLPPRAGSDALALARVAAAAGASFVKIALSGAGEGSRDLLGRLVRVVRGSGTATRVVAVAYADARPEAAGWPLELPALAEDAGAAAAMLDTASKDGTSLLDHLQETELARFVAACRASGLLAGLAGSLDGAAIRRLAPLGPDVVGVRGAACRGGREGRVDAGRVRRLAHLVLSQRPSCGTTISARTPAGSASAK